MSEDPINEFENSPIAVIGIKVIDAFTDELGDVHILLIDEEG